MTRPQSALDDETAPAMTLAMGKATTGGRQKDCLCEENVSSAVPPRRPTFPSASPSWSRNFVPPERKLAPPRAPAAAPLHRSEAGPRINVTKIHGRRVDHCAPGHHNITSTHTSFDSSCPSPVCCPAPRSNMASTRDAPNPLRPYYMPPSIGLPPDAAHNHSSTASYSARTPKPSFGSQARDMLSDLDYDSYFPDTSPTFTEHAKRLVDQALWNYTSVLLAQPFEVAKTILQVHQAPGQTPPGLQVNGEHFLRSRPSSFASGKFEDYPSDDSEDDDSPGYFTSTAPRAREPFSPADPTHAHSPERRRSKHAPHRSNSSTPTQAYSPGPRKLDLRKPDSLLEVIAQLWAKESAWGVWKATNVTFVYNFLLKTSESWTRSLLSALLNVPDPGLMGLGATGIGGLDIIDSPSPVLSLAVAVSAAALAALALAPLDLIRTRLILTPTSAPPRTIYPSLSLLPSLTLSPSLFPATLIHATLPTLISSSTPLLLRSTFSIDPVITPSTYTFATFLSSTAELFVRLPIETVLRRGQVAVLQDHEDARLASAFRNIGEKQRREVFGMENEDPSVRSFRTIVEPGPFKGVWGTMWFIVREEGVRLGGRPGVGAGGPAGQWEGVSGAAQVKQQTQIQKGTATGFSTRRARKGQGVHGLWRGWRVGFWGLVGVWGAAAMGSGGGEF